MDTTTPQAQAEDASVATVSPPDPSTNGSNGPESGPVEEAPPRLRRQARADLVTIERGAVGLVQAERAEMHGALAGMVFGSKDVTLDRGGAREVVAGGAVRLSRGGAGTILAGGDASVTQGGAGMLVSLGHVEIRQGGACGLVAGAVTVGRGGIVGLAITPRLEVADGGRVLAGPPMALGAVAGVATGVVLGWLIGRTRR
jgi:hypothetical protein